MVEFGLRAGSADLRSAGPITFGPAGILFLADNVAAKVFAVDVADPGPAGGSEPFDLENVDVRVGSFLGCEPGDVVIRDMAVHPVSHNAYLSVQRGRGDAAQPVPRRAWARGSHRLIVDPVLEDLAGNSVSRVFDRDLSRPEDEPRPARPVSVPFRPR